MNENWRPSCSRMKRLARIISYSRWDMGSSNNTTPKNCHIWLVTAELVIMKLEMVEWTDKSTADDRALMRMVHDSQIFKIKVLASLPSLTNGGISPNIPTVGTPYNSLKLGHFRTPQNFSKPFETDLFCLTIFSQEWDELHLRCHFH